MTEIISPTSQKLHDPSVVAGRFSAPWLRSVLLSFVLTRGLVLAVAFLMQWLLEEGHIIHYGFIGDGPLSPLSETFDGNWYSSVATGGYSTSANVALQQNYHFFPFYPASIRLLGTLLGLGNVHGGYSVAGVIASHLFFIAALIMLYKVTYEVWSDKMVASYSVWAMALLPWSFVFSMTYTESLFLLLSLAALWVAFKARQNPTFIQALAAGLLTCLAALTRPQGIILILPVVWLLVLSPERMPFKARLINGAACVLPPIVGVLSFFIYVGVITGDTWALLKVNRTWGDGWFADLGRLVILPPANPIWFVDAVTTIGLIVWLALTTGLVKRTVAGRRLPDTEPKAEPDLRAFTLYSVAYLAFTALSSPSNSSWGRYMLVVFPCIWMVAFLYRSLEKRPAARMLVVSSLLVQLILFAGALTSQITP